MRFLLARRAGLLTVLALAVVGLVAALPAGAAPRRANGMLAFARYNPAIDDTQAYVINPDGLGEQFIQGPTDHGENPAWFPDGIHIATGGASDLPGGGSRIINVDNGTWRDVDGQDPNLFNPCGTPSPDGTLLLCETFTNDASGSQNGIHTIRSSDGGGFTQITSNPGGDDVPGSWSPNGMRIVFQRYSANGDYEGMFVVNLNGTGLKQILPPTVSANCCTFNWSPQGNEIAFSRHVTPDVHSSLWVVHSDGSGLHPLPVPPGSGCGGSNDDPAAIGCLDPAWSPDGTKIAFAGGFNLDLDGEIYTMNLDGTGFTQVTHTGGSQSPNWGTHPLTG
jgi:Tol biopolymer transport system component